MSYSIVIPVLDPSGKWTPNPGLNRPGWKVTAACDEGTPRTQPKDAWWDITHSPKPGKGASLRVAAEHVLSTNPRSVVFTDADAFLVEHILTVGRYAQDWPVVIAQRSQSGHINSPYRQLLHQTVKKVIHPRGVDTQTGLKGFRPDLLKHILSAESDLFRGRYEYDLRVFRWLHKQNIRPMMLPFDEIPGSGGDTQVRPFADLWPCFKAVLGRLPPTGDGNWAKLQDHPTGGFGHVFSDL